MVNQENKYMLWGFSYAIYYGFDRESLFKGRFYRSLREKRLEKQKLKRDAKISRINKEFERINSLVKSKMPVIGEGVSISRAELG